MDIKLQNKINKSNHSTVFMPKIFENIKCDFGDFKMLFNYTNDMFEVFITSATLTNDDIQEIYWNFYSYLNILLGYFPIIEENSFMSKEKLDNIADQYKTKECYVRASEQYIKAIDESTFKKSFNEFRKIYQKASFTISMFNVSMMDSTHYPEIAVIYLLQSLDGLYEEIFSNKTNNQKIRKQKLYYIKDILNDLNIENISTEEYESIKGYMGKIGDITYIDKLRFLINLTKFDIFEYEKKLPIKDKNSFENLLNKFVHTRNKFSHSIKKNDTLSGTEAAVYIFKLIMLYRLLLFEKIGISHLINADDFKENLKEWNKYIAETLKKYNQ